MYLSKSDFKVARTCETKLYYRKLSYPTAQDDDPYVEFLADGGYMVEAIAKLLFPDGKEMSPDIAGDAQAEFTATMEALKQENVTLFEATLLHGQLLAQVDILEKRGNNFRLVEVKAKSVEPQENLPSPFRGSRGRISAKWIPYLEDVAYQSNILRQLFPEASITPCLCVVDKTKSATVGTTFDKFHLIPRSKEPDGRSFQKPQVTFTGDLAELVGNPFVRVFDVTQEVKELSPAVEKAAETLAATLTSDRLIRTEPKLGVICKKCEYRIEPLERNGFRECWGRLADPSPHLLDLHNVGRLGADRLATMIHEGKTGLTEISPDCFQGKIGERQSIQFEWTLKNEEFISAELPRLLADCKYPLHFLDFEASRIAVPYHPGMHPYEQVAFQWSCHTILVPGAKLGHHEWINVDNAYPNFDFARSLKQVLAGDGTVFVWSSFEKSALEDVKEQLNRYGQDDPQLSEWLALMVGDPGPIVDLLRLAKEYYFHPAMRGSLSIKDVLPAVWFENVALHSHPWFAGYFEEQGGKILEPYETLDPLPFGQGSTEEEGEAVRQGTAAIRTYQEMMYGLRRSDPTFRQAMKQLLLNYCKLDTAAMVMIWMHWIGGAK
jgi:hypothetical protein